MRNARIAAWFVFGLAVAELAWVVRALIKLPDNVWRDMHFPITTFAAAPLLAVTASIVAAREEMSTTERVMVVIFTLMVVAVSLKWIATLRVLW